MSGTSKIVRAEPIERSGAHLRIAIIEFGIQRSQKFSTSALNKVETGLQTGKSFFMKERFRQPDGKLQIFALGGDRFAGEFDDQGPIGDLAFALPVAHAALRRPDGGLP